MLILPLYESLPLLVLTAAYVYFVGLMRKCRSPKSLHTESQSSVFFRGLKKRTNAVPSTSNARISAAKPGRAWGRVPLLYMYVYLYIFTGRDATTTSHERQFSHFSRWHFVVVYINLFSFLRFSFVAQQTTTFRFQRNDFDIIRTQKRLCCRSFFPCVRVFPFLFTVSTNLDSTFRQSSIAFPFEMNVCPELPLASSSHHRMAFKHQLLFIKKPNYTTEKGKRVIRRESLLLPSAA